MRAFPTSLTPRLARTLPIAVSISLATLPACSRGSGGHRGSDSSSASASPVAPLPAPRAARPGTAIPSPVTYPLTSGPSSPVFGASFTPHPEHIQPGLALARPGPDVRNPYEGDKRAVDVGSKLFIAYNCVDCHGTDGSGAMAPSLADSRWHFGGTPAEVFESIYEGRPDGMPAWGGRISDDQIWMLVAYVRSLSAGKDVSTENFSGQTIERTGH